MENMAELPLNKSYVVKLWYTCTNELCEVFFPFPFLARPTRKDSAKDSKLFFQRHGSTGRESSVLYRSYKDTTTSTIPPHQQE